MQTNWAKFKQLTAVEKLLLTQAVILLPINALGLRVVGFYRWQALLAGALAKVEMQISAPPEDLIAAQTLGRIVNIAAAYGVYQVQCLPRSMTLWWLLRRRKIVSELRIGVRKDADNLAAHAWVECGGEVINDRADVREHFMMLGEHADSFLFKTKHPI